MIVRLYEQPRDEVTLAGPKHFWHAEQQRFVKSSTRFEAACGGRRSGKSRIARDKLISRALLAHETHPHVVDYKAIIGAPTRDQVKRLHWRQTLAAIPPLVLRACDVSKSELRVGLPNGASIWFVGFDVPERAEGEAIDDALLDEFADMKEESWKLAVRSSLGTLGREGRCTFIGKPRGRNHWYRIWSEAAEKNGWDQFHWNAEDILAPAEIEALREDLDPITYDQEVRANFVNFSGRAYYAFIREVQATHRLEYDASRALDFTFDFNVEPGTAGVSQEQQWERRTTFDTTFLAGEYVEPWIKGRYTALFDEVWIPQNSSTLAVAKALIKKWGDRHRGLVNLYGDATGGARKTSALSGTDWDILKREFAKVHNWTVKYRVPRQNPPQRDRVNAVNARFMTSDGRVRFMICPYGAPHHVDDFEGVTLKDGSGEIETKDKWLTHCSDGAGYKVHRVAPVRVNATKAKQI